MMRPIVACLVVLLLLLPAASARGDAWERLYECHRVLYEILEMPDAIPTGLLDKAECAIVIPSVKKLALGIGGSYGRGALVCRGGADFTGPWGPPAMIRMEGGNFGLQIGGEATDYILLVMNKKGAEAVMRSTIKLGADASAAAGPKGRTAKAATDIRFRSEILSYSRAQGLFIGISVEGSTLRSDKGANEDLYGGKLNSRAILEDDNLEVPKAAKRLVELLRTTSPVNKSEDASPPKE